MNNDQPVQGPGDPVNFPRRMPQRPARRYDRMMMGNGIGHHAKKGYATYKPTIYGKQCKFCQGSGVRLSVITKKYDSCPECQ